MRPIPSPGIPSERGVEGQGWGKTNHRKNSDWERGGKLAQFLGNWDRAPWEG